ncbi:hypothetical protein DERF_005520 [Dermatophagoides farinae]|uniref:Uncharacterized protein n=1 Tax=Dermatophagoides farinae TaxID=6954 RepID=A0A922L784_DERFA|nr:hypothetical protein DERF_005520 [Dermatophagoides farinae]KAH9521904.1 hypothetical protein DERF_005520 [Dermatophagoides farinae]
MHSIQKQSSSSYNIVEHRVVSRHNTIYSDSHRYTLLKFTNRNLLDKTIATLEWSFTRMTAHMFFEM